MLENLFQLLNKDKRDKPLPGPGKLSVRRTFSL